MIRMHNNGLPVINTDWGKHGRPKLLENAEVNKLAIDSTKERGKTNGSKELRNEISNINKNKIIARGCVLLSTAKDPC